MIFSDASGRISDQAPQVSFLDHGFLFGDSVYEVVRLYDGKLFGWVEHRERLLKSCQRLQINIESELGSIENRIRELFQSFAKSNAALRIIITRGVGKLNIDPRSCEKPQIYMAVWEFDQTSAPTSVRIMISRMRRNHRLSMDPRIKSGNYLNNIMAIQEAIASGYDDALMLNPEGFLTELTTSNIAWFRDSKWETPSMESGILYGTTRHFLVKDSLLKEGLFKEEDLRQATEIVALSTLKEVVPVSEIRWSDGTSKNFDKPKNWLQIQEKFRDTVTSHLQSETGLVG